MLLAIDCGNTNTVFSIWDGEQFLATWRIASDHKRTADEYYVWLQTLMTLKKLDVVITEAIISSTVPRVVFNLRVLCNRYFDCRPLVVGSRARRDADRSAGKPLRSARSAPARPQHLNALNRRMRTRMSGGVGGE